MVPIVKKLSIPEPPCTSGVHREFAGTGQVARNRARCRRDPQGRRFVDGTPDIGDC